MSEIGSSKRISESIKTPSSVSFVLHLIEEPTKLNSAGVFEHKRAAFFRVGFHLVVFEARKKHVRYGI